MTAIRSLLLALALPLCGCGTVAPTSTTQTAVVFEFEPSIYVIAAKQKPEIVASLRQAGIVMIDDLAESSHQLRVTLGVDKSFRDCGTLNNVKYALRRQGTGVLDIQGRGWTGQCHPSVFDEMSQELARTVLAGLASGRER